MNPELSPAGQGSPEETSDFAVQGMTCANCVGRVERALSKVPGVHVAHVNLATQRASVRYDPAVATPDALAEAVTSSGYRVPLAPSVQRGATSARVSARERARILGDAEAREERALQRDVRVGAAFSVPLIALAMSHGLTSFGETAVGRVTQLALATPVLFGPGRRFLTSAYHAARQRSADMNTLVSLGALSAYGYSALAIFAPQWLAPSHHGKPPLYFEAGAAIVTFVLFGKLLEARARKRLSAAVHGLGQLLPTQATRLLSAKGDRTETIELDAVQRGDRLLVRAGERIPNDGEVIDGEGSVDESMLTGESMPVDKVLHAKVVGGSLLREGALTIRVSDTGDDTVLARIIDAVEQAQGARAPVARLADRVSAWFVPVVLAIAVLTLGVWLFVDPSAHGISFALERFVSVLVIACPCALGLATPAAVAVGTGRAAELGVLFKGGAALEAMNHVRSILFDKTGTLTEGAPQLVKILARGVEDDALLAFAASVERRSAHPVAQAIVQAALARGLTLADAQRFRSAVSAGAEAVVDGKHVRVGTAAWLASAGVASDAMQRELGAATAVGHTPVFVAIDGVLAGLFQVADAVRGDARALLRTLERQKVAVAMITGDRKATAEAIGRELGIVRVIAEVTPEDKARLVREETERTKGVAMVGDGINDAPALVAADVGIAVGRGTDVALASADVVLMRNGIAALPTALAIARATMRAIRQNLFWAFAFNLVGIPLAAGALYAPFGWLLSPMFASAAMSLSSVSVLANSLRLRRYTPRTEAA